MRLLFSLLLVCCFLSNMYSFDNSSNYTFTDEEISYLKLRKSVETFVDKNDQYDIQDILTNEAVQFTPQDQHGNEIIKAPVVIWSKIQLTNDGTAPREGFLNINLIADSIWIYTIENGKIVESTFTGNSFKPLSKSFFSDYNYYPIRLNPEVTQTFIFRVKYSISKSMTSMQIPLHYYSRDVLWKKKLTNFSFQSFYAGTLTIFALFSIFMFFIFREKVFIYFSLFMFSFIGYFIFTNNLFSFIFNYHETNNLKYGLLIFVSLIVLTFSLFFSEYSQISKRFPKVSKIYFAYTLFLSLFAHVMFALNVSHFLIANLNNIFTLVWILFSTVLIILAARRKDKSSRILLISLSILILGSSIYIVDLLGLLPFTFDSVYPFQIGTILFSGTLFYGLFDKINTIQNEKKQFEELDQMKSQFFANISHEFRTPLTLVLSPLQDVMEKQTDEGDKKRLQLAHQNASRLLKLINQILDLSKLEAGKMLLQTQVHNFPSLLKGIVLSFESLATRKNIQLHFISQNETIPLYIDKDKIEVIFFNLLSNALKFTPEQGEISVMITEQKNQIEIMVRDNGIGMSEARLENIFNRFFHLDSTEVMEQQGTGIGLALVKELVQIHQGEIKVESEEGKGTTFYIRFPKGKAHLKEHEILLPTIKPVASASSIHPKEIDIHLRQGSILESDNIIIKNPDANGLPIVLIIEDNADVRLYIKQNLEISFQIIEAKNGEEGVTLALQHLPDLIISDVMMPKKNGYEVCGILKTDQRSSHIPIILLTAKAAQEEKLHGLETGADDYLIKPFDIRELNIRVRNIVNSRAQLHQLFATANSFEAIPPATNKVDNEFLEKVLSIIQDNFSNTQFSVDFLAKEIGLTVTHLSRKLKALTDLSTSKFIQTYRLQKAYDLLQNQMGNVSEVADQTGFTSTAYFIKCFREKYGKTPGTILSQNMSK